MSHHALKPTLSILMAQINPTVGAVVANTEHMIHIIKTQQQQHDLIIFPELAITGYPIEDLIFREDLLSQVEVALKTIQDSVGDCHVIVGHPSREHEVRFNSASIFFNKQCLAQYHKHHLPNYGVFDEARYFSKGPKAPCLFTLKTHRLGLLICEDLWQEGPVEALLQEQVELIVSINASPFDKDKHATRTHQLQQQTRGLVPLLYVNLVGGQDELVFDGRSCAINATGAIEVEAEAFAESLCSLTYNNGSFSSKHTPSNPSEAALMYRALTCGLRDYVNKNNFPGVLLGLSGGIDSALTLALAVDALGAHRVTAVLMPSRYTASMSEEDALAEVKALGVAHLTLPIEAPFECILQTLSPVLSKDAPGITEENIQARIRGMLLMALSNKTHQMLLCTTNKSESAVGYGTLYGDLCGGFAVLKDVYKTMVYTLAHYRNSISPVIPERVLTRPPSAELAYHQLDEDSLPEYGLLDTILEAYIEEQLDAEAMIARGLPQETVLEIIGRITRNEYKRRQTPPGIKITTRAFGRDWRYPITKRLQN